jgi:hypothetical protein
MNISSLTTTMRQLCRTGRGCDAKTERKREKSKLAPSYEREGSRSKDLAQVSTWSVESFTPTAQGLGNKKLDLVSDGFLHSITQRGGVIGWV